MFRGLVLLLGWMALSWVTASPQTISDLKPTQLTDEIVRVAGEDILFLKEPADAELSAADVWSRLDAFEAYGTKTIDFGFIGQPVWIIFRVQNDRDEAQLGTLSTGRPELMKAEIYLIGEDGPEQLYSHKSDQNYRQRFREYLALAESTEFAPVETKTILVRLQSSHSSAFPLAVANDDVFRQAVDVRLNIIFVFTTVTLTIIAVNIALMILVEQTRLLWFPAAQLFAVYGAWQINRYPYLLIEPQGREMSRFIDQFLTVGGILLLLQFARVFFQTSQSQPRANRFALGLILIGCGFLLLEFMGLFTDAYAPGFFVGPTTLLWLICFGTLIWIAVMARLKGVAGSGWIIAAWSIYGGIITYMVIEGVTILPPMPFQPGILLPLVALESILITHALGYFARRNIQLKIEANETAERALTRQVVALQDLADRSRLLLAMGHDGRNLLGGLNYLSDRIQSSSTLDGAKSHAARLQDVSTMLSDMLNIMVDNGASGEGTHGPVLIEPVNVNTLLATVRIVAGKAASQKGIEINTRSALGEVLTDHVRVFRILTNLVSNAGKYADDGKILLTCRLRENEVRFQVFDQGSGLTEEEVERLREFRPVRFNDRETGEGVGLTICQEFANDLGGEIRISSKKGRGSVFELCLPVSFASSEAENIRLGVAGNDDQWLGIASAFDLVDISGSNADQAIRVDALLFSDADTDSHERAGISVPALVVTFEKNTEIRARWAGKAAALIYSPVSAKGVAVALIAAGIKPNRRIKGAGVDDANSDC